MAGILTNGVRETQDLALATYNAALAEGMASVREEDMWDREIAMEIPSTAETEVYDWLEASEDFSEWENERRFQDLRENAYALKNKDWSWGATIKRNKFEDHRFLSEARVFQLAGVNARMHPQRRLAWLLKNYAAAGQECWDGLSYFHTAHPVDYHDDAKGTFSNRFTNALSAASFNLARAHMMTFKDASGELIASPPDTMFVSPTLVTTADLIAQSIALPTITGTANTGIGTAPRQKIRVVECPELSAEPNVWYLARTRGPIKPMIFQRRSSPVVEWISDINSEFCKLNKKVRLGADYRAAFGWTFPQLMIRLGDGTGGASTLS